MKNNITSLILLTALTTYSHAAINGPYTTDSDTVHLWHMDEVNPGPATDSAGSMSLTPGNSAVLGATGFTGFGTAGNTNANDNSEFVGSEVAVSSLTGATGAYTFEAMVNLSSITDYQQIMSMEGGNGSRSFQFRISNGEIGLANINGNNLNLDLTIPTTGDHAFVANEWFHVALTYNGIDNTADNASFYWTKVDASETEANLLGTGMTDDLLDVDTTLVLGNTFRTSGSQDNNIQGLIDEARISSIARGADDFIYAVPEPSASAALLGLVVLGTAMRRRRG